MHEPRIGIQNDARIVVQPVPQQRFPGLAPKSHYHEGGYHEPVFQPRLVTGNRSEALHDLGRDRRRTGTLSGIDVDGHPVR